MRIQPIATMALSALAGAVATALVMGSVAQSQGMSATVTPAQKPGNELSALRLQLNQLALRVTELEKEKVEVVKDNADDDAQVKRLEQRLAGVESAQAKLAAADAADRPGKTGDSDDDNTGLTVRAPFVVLDESGRTIFRADTSQGYPRAVVGNPVGGRVQMGVNTSNEGVLVIYDKANSTRIGMVGGDKSYIRMVSPTEKRATLLGSSDDGGYGLFMSKAAVGSVNLRVSQSGAGYLSMTNGSGAIVAEGGAKTNGVGIFRTGPSCCAPPGAVGPHQYIVGRPE